MGIITGALQGLGEGLMKGAEFYGRHLLQQQAEEATAARDQTLMALREQADIRAEDRKREPYKLAAKDAEGLITKRLADMNPVANDDEGNPVPRASLAPGEESRLRAQALRGRGLESDAAVAENNALRAEEADKDRKFRSEESDKTLAAHERLAAMTDARVREEAKLTRAQQLELHKERMTEMRSQFRNAGLSVQSTQDGMFIVDARTNKATPLTGPDGKPLKSLREDDSLKMVGALGHLAKSASDTGDSATAKLFLDLATNMVKGRGGAAAVVEPTDEDIKGLRARRNDPAALEHFRRRTGQDPAKYLDPVPDKPNKPETRAGATTPEQPVLPSAPGSQAAALQQRNAGAQADRTRNAALESRSDSESKTMVQSAFDQDLVTLAPDQLFEQYDSVTGRLTPAQLIKYQQAIRSIR